jgi:signal transduction histidine kinase
VDLFHSLCLTRVAGHSPGVRSCNDNRFCLHSITIAVNPVRLSRAARIGIVSAMYEFMRKVPFFANLTDADLRSLVQSAQEVHLAPGQELFAEGSTGKLAYIIREGELEIMKQVDGRPILLSVRSEPGQIIGEMALLESTPRTASVRARTQTSLLAIYQDQFEALLNNSPAATRMMLHMVLERWRNNELLLRQSEKMAQLGTLTAGMAHELNNPAAAVKRGVDQIGSAILDAQQAYGALLALGVSAHQQTALQGLAQQAQARMKLSPQLSALERSDREFALERWLDEQGVTFGWQMAPTLVSLGYSTDELASLVTEFGPDHFKGMIQWLSAHAAVYEMLAEIGEGAQRVSDIVNVLKGYVYLDQAPLQTVDIHEGINNTLLILRKKLGSGVTIDRQFSPDLPKIEAYASELNQVWTNLIDNAVDAMQGEGEIKIRSRRQGDGVIVEIEDNGPGIAPEIQKRLFDPFFTTKPPGKGMGLGLEIVYNIVVHKHHGHIDITSVPGSTCCKVWLPIDFEAAKFSPRTP